MSDFIISLLLGVGVGAYAWSKFVRLSGNADPTKITAGAAVVGIIAFLFLYSLLKWVLHIG